MRILPILPLALAASALLAPAASAKHHEPAVPRAIKAPAGNTLVKRTRSACRSTRAATAGKVAEVPYTADYHFYKPAKTRA